VFVCVCRITSPNRCLQNDSVEIFSTGRLRLIQLLDTVISRSRLRQFATQKPIQHHTYAIHDDKQATSHDAFSFRKTPAALLFRQMSALLRRAVTRHQVAVPQTAVSKQNCHFLRLTVGILDSSVGIVTSL